MAVRADQSELVNADGVPLVDLPADQLTREDLGRLLESSEVCRGARHLTQRLQSLGVCDVTPAAVHAWQLEDPPVPILRAGGRGQAHWYRIADVRAWYAQREGADHLKGWTAPGAADSGHDVAPPAAGHADPAAAAAASPPPGEDPRRAKLREEAAIARIKRLELERQLVPIDELEPAYQARVQQARASSDGWPAKLARLLDGSMTFEERRRIIADERDHFFELLAGTSGAAAQQGGDR